MLSPDLRLVSHPLTSLHRMTGDTKLWRRIQAGHSQNVDFRDFCRLIESFDFKLHRQRGSHLVYANGLVKEIISVQPKGDGSAKAYQVRQLRNLVREYDLRMSKGGTHE